MATALDWFVLAGVDRWNFAVLDRQRGWMINHDRPRDREEVERAISWAWVGNKAGHDVYLRPARFIDDADGNPQPASWAVIFFDDVPDHDVRQITNGALIVKTSPNRNHVWIRVSEPLTETERASAQGLMATGMNADPRSTSGDHWGRAPGYKNMKPGRGGCWVGLVGVVDGAALTPVVVETIPHAQRAACTSSISSKSSPSGADESGRAFGFVIGRLRWAASASGVSYAEVRARLISEQIEIAFARGKRPTRESCRAWVESLVASAEKEIPFRVAP
ncbi:MAG: DNA-primase RepB domain-containing protein [Sulfurisoma sp.]|nr:DNA-primase RepB domain-containing protein [Sulfurisoma sp.]